MDISTNMAALRASGAMTAQPGKAAPDAAKNATDEFEAMFLSQMVNEMLSQVDIGDFGGGQAEEHWRSFLADAFGREIAEQNGGGLMTSLRGALDAYAQADSRADGKVEK